MSDVNEISQASLSVDIAICGAGPVGQALALMLIKRGVNPANIALIDAKTEQQAANDVRSIALSYGSRQLLEQVGAWPIVSTAIEQIHVSRQGYFGRTLIDCNAHQVPALGYVARYKNIIAPLNNALKNIPQLHFLRPHQVVHIIDNPNDKSVVIALDNHPQIHAAIVVQAEGGLFGEQTQQAEHIDYQQTAIISHVTASAPIAARAYERFTAQGPLALLPQENGYALVWCANPATAEQLKSLDEPAFLSALQSAFGERVGRFISCQERHTFALGLNAHNAAPTGRCIRIGNAAQTLHPVAGQGLNLGLRDAYQLAKYISTAATPQALHDFDQSRQTDRQRTKQLTSTMAQVFTTQNPSDAANLTDKVKQTCLGGALGLIDTNPPAQQWLAQQMMFGVRR